MKLWNELQKAHNSWENLNFPGQPIEYSAMGLLEEFGELSHARLKSLQGIRGTQEEHEAKEKDALSDMMIYMLGFLGKRGFQFTDIVNEAGEPVVGYGYVEPVDEKECWRDLAREIGQLCYFQEYANKHNFGRVMHLMGMYPRMKQWDTSLYALTENTWTNIVSKRDWITDPTEGGGHS